MQRALTYSRASRCPVTSGHPLRQQRLPSRSVTACAGLRDEVAELNTGKSPVEELSGETNTMVTDVMDIDRTAELLTWVFSGLFGRTTQPSNPATWQPDPTTGAALSSSTATTNQIHTADATTSSATEAADGVSRLSAGSSDTPPSAAAAASPSQTQPTEVATVSGGCFWCIEACFRELQGVLSVASGYAGGHVPNPTYQQVCSKTTGHAEVVQIEYDPAVLSYRDILQILMTLHDPTTPNRSGNDGGPQYRSIILTHDERQAEVAAEVLTEVNGGLWFGRKTCTEVAPLRAFYPAESYHQRYYSRNPGAGYCVFVVRPKLQEFRRKYAKLLRNEVGTTTSAL